VRQGNLRTYSASKNRGAADAAPYAVASSARFANIAYAGTPPGEGAVAALDVAQALKTLDPRLNPFLIEVAREPEWFADTKSGGSAQTSPNGPQIPDMGDFRPLSSWSNIVAVNATRIARGYETIIQAPEQIDRLNNYLGSWARLYICPQCKEYSFSRKLHSLTDGKDDEMEHSLMENTRASATQGWKSVSLGWWLSAPLQAHLDGEIYSEHNKKAQKCIISLLRSTNGEGLAASAGQCD
jgi:hypothetical protein